MVALTVRRGYAACSVADLVELSGVSSRSFYDLFADKEDCFLATLDEALNGLEAVATAQLDGTGTMQERAARATRGLAELAVSQPAAARFCLVDSYGVGDHARKRLDESTSALAELLGVIFAGLPERRGMPPELTRAIVGGLIAVLYRCLARDEPGEVPALAQGLHDWAFGIPPPPRPLRPKGRRPKPVEADLPPFAAYVPAERVLRGFASAVAQKGYLATTIADVAAVASISQNTFYAHFRDKEDVLYGALDSSGAQLLAAVLPAIRRTPNWPAALRVAMETACGFLAAEPAFAQLREVEVYTIGPRAVEHRDRAQTELLRELRKLADSPAPRGVALEATLGAIRFLFYERVRAGTPTEVTKVAPFATYLALAPSMGAEAAWEAALG
jgi:TetR/AcrR family transcriptional regulator